MWDVIGVGANSVDLVNLLPAFPQPSGWFSKIRVTRQETRCGGQTATTLATCASLGLRARYVGAIGSDDHGKRLRAELAGRGVDTAGIVERDAGNASALILLDERTGERTVLWHRDERLALHPSELHLEWLADARLLHVDDVDLDAAIPAAARARELGLPVTSDLDRVTDRTGELLSLVTHAVFAEDLPVRLTGVSDREGALRQLRLRHEGLLCVTIGRGGAVALDGERFLVSPGVPVKVVDSTGAGDVFRGAFIHGLLAGWPTERILRFANAAAAFSCTRLGAMAGVPRIADIERVLGEAG